jgi:multiple sugar transport system permease protein
MAARGSLRREEMLWAYVFLAPWIVGLVVFIFGPMLFSLLLSFYTYTLGSESYTFVGLDNWIRALSGKDEFFWPSVWRTFVYTAVVVPLSVFGALGTAMLLNQGLRGTSVYRTMFFVPSLTPIVATAALWAWILAADIGPLNNLLGLVGIRGPRWFGQAEWAIPGIAIIVLWGAVGGSRMITFLAGLQGVPQELYDAAAIDGANGWRRFRHVTLPLLTPVIFFNVVLGVIGSFQVFEVAFVATQGGPGEATYFYALHVYNKAFRDFEFGYAAALAWAMFLILLAFTQLQFRGAARWVHYEAEQK